jgi:hypothetical protein
VYGARRLLMLDGDSKQVNRQRRNELGTIVLIGKVITKSMKIKDNLYHFFICVLTQRLTDQLQKEHHDA